MVQLRTGFEAMTGVYSTNAALLPAGTGETAVTAIIGGAANLTAVTTNVYKGTKALQLNPVASQPCAVRIALPTASVQPAFDFVVRTPNVVTGEVYLITPRGSTGNVMNVTYLPTGFIRMRVGSTSNLWTSTVAVPTATQVRIKGVLDIQAVAANSRFKVGMFNPDTDASLGAGAATPDWITFTPGDTSVSTIQFGKVSFDTDVTSFIIDEVRVETAATDYIAAAASNLTSVTTVSPISGPAPLAVTATVTLTNAVGTKTYAFNWGDGQTTAAQSSNTATHTYSAAGTYTVTSDVPDN